MDNSAIVTFIIPVYNEAEVVPVFSREMSEMIEDANGHYRFEFLFIDDGSIDSTVENIRSEFRNFHHTILSFSRNFGKEAALCAGIDHADGDVVIIMDVDLQDPPALVPEFLQHWKAGFEVVYGVRHDRASDSWVKRKSASGFYSIFNMVSDIKIPPHAGDFRLLDKSVVQALRKLPERSRFTKGLYAWAGFKSKGVPYVRTERIRGDTKWSYWRLWNLAVDGLFSFSQRPLRIWAYIGATVSGLSLLFAASTVIKALFFGIETRGYASIMTAVTFLGGLQLLVLGIFGEYIGRLFIETKGRPNYLVAKEWHRNPESETEPSQTS